MAKRPRGIVVGRVRARAVRGPQKDAPRVWYWRAERYCRDADRDVTVWTGWATRDDAQRHLEAHVADLARRPRSERSQASCSTLTDLLAYWLGEIEDRREAGQVTTTTLDLYEKRARIVREHIGDMPIDRVTALTVDEYRRSRLRAGYSDATVEAEALVIMQAWKWAAAVGLHPYGLIEGVRWRRPEPARPKITPTEEEVLATLAHMTRWPRDVVQLLWATGCRIGELADMTPSQWSRSAQVWRLGGKTGSREVPVGPRAAAIIERLVDGVAPDRSVWPVGRYSVHSGVTRRYIPMAAEAAGVRVFTPHGLRRAAVDRMLRSGVDVATASQITGHSVQTMLEYYRQVTASDRRRAVEVAQLDALECAPDLRLVVGETPHRPSAQGSSDPESDD